MTGRSHRALGVWAIFRVPAMLAVLALFGLVAALLEDGAWDWIGSTALASIVVAAVVSRIRSRN